MKKPDPTCSPIYKYKDRSGNSGISRYRTGYQTIAVEFKAGGIYVYTWRSADSENIEEMGRRAKAGERLTTFINQFVNEYAGTIESFDELPAFIRSNVIDSEDSAKP